MEIEDNRPRRVSRIKGLTKLIVPVITIILILVYMMLSLLPGKGNVDLETSKNLLNVALALAPVKDVPWNQTKS